MKKNFMLYTVGWALLLGLFNLITFIVPGANKFGESFWIGYAFITVMFIGQLVCAYFVFNQDSNAKAFYNISLLKLSVGGLVSSFIFGSLCMIFSFIPYWVSTILCAVVLVLNVISLLKAKVVVTAVEEVDKKVKTKTFFIKSITIDAETLMASADDEEVKAECRKVAEALRYSDPMSNDALASVESQITLAFSDLYNAVHSGNKEKVAPAAKNLLVLIADRNKKCMLLK